MKKTRGKKSFSSPDYDDSDWQSMSPLSPPSTAASSPLQQAMMDSYQSMLDAMSVTPKWISGGALAVAESAKPKPLSVDKAKLEALKTAEPYKVTRRMPDYISVFTGWRAWAVEGMKLKALGMHGVWPTKKAIEATCQAGSGLAAMFTPGASSAKHDAPQMNCSCGVWAFKELDSLVAAIGTDYGSIQVLGKVSLWGRIVETENGYRAEKAYPSELWIFDPALEQLGFEYDVPVRMIQ